MSGLKDQVPGVDQSAALENDSASKASAGYLVTAFGRIDSTAATDDYYVQFYDSATVPADGTVTFLLAPIRIAHTTGTSSTVDLDLKREYIYASAGISWAISTTEFTKTVAGDVASMTVLYK